MTMRAIADVRGTATDGLEFVLSPDGCDVWRDQVKLGWVTMTDGLVTSVLIRSGRGDNQWASVTLDPDSPTNSVRLAWTRAKAVCPLVPEAKGGAFGTIFREGR